MSSSSSSQQQKRGGPTLKINESKRKKPYIKRPKVKTFYLTKLCFNIRPFDDEDGNKIDTNIRKFFREHLLNDQYQWLQIFSPYTLENNIENVEVDFDVFCQPDEENGQYYAIFETIIIHDAHIQIDGKKCESLMKEHVARCKFSHARPFFIQEINTVTDKETMGQLPKTADYEMEKYLSEYHNDIFNKMKRRESEKTKEQISSTNSTTNLTTSNNNNSDHIIINSDNNSINSKKYTSSYDSDDSIWKSDSDNDDKKKQNKQYIQQKY